jgi:hypothetical protein
MERAVSQNEKPDFSKALAVGRELDLKLPDSRTVRDAYAEAEAVSQPWVFNHVARSWLYGARLTRHRGLAPDAELVAVSVLLHDLGLARGGAPDRRFEVLGADLGRGYNELSDDNKKAILSTFPRLGMKNELTTCLCGIAKNYPNTTSDNFIADFGLKYVPGYMRASSVDFLHQSPFSE